MAAHPGGQGRVDLAAEVDGDELISGRSAVLYRRGRASTPSLYCRIKPYWIKAALRAAPAPGVRPCRADPSRLGGTIRSQCSPLAVPATASPLPSSRVIDGTSRTAVKRSGAVGHGGFHFRPKSP